MTDFNKELALSLINSDVDFPVDLDDAWQWLGYSTKQKALRTLKSYFQEGMDFLTFGQKVSSGGRPSESVRLTVECFKTFGMIANTQKGREIRFYFLQCEEELKQIKSTGQTPQPVASAPSPSEISEFVTMILSITGIDKPLIAASAANHVAKHYPILRPVAEDLKKELVVETQEELLTPTELGQILEQRTGAKHSAQRVNKLLMEHGLQQPNPTGKDPAWVATPKGAEFSKLLLAAQKGVKDATRQHLQWYRSVVEQFERQSPPSAKRGGEG